METGMFAYYNPTKKYRVPMTKLNSPEYEKEELVDCTITISYRGKGSKRQPSFITCTKEGYENKGFYPEFFGWLIYTKYVVEIPEDTKKKE